MKKKDLLKKKEEDFKIKVHKIYDKIIKAEELDKENSKKYINWIKEISEPNLHFIKHLSKYFFNDLTTKNTKEKILKILKQLYELNKDIVKPQINAHKDLAKYLSSYINSDIISKISKNINDDNSVNKTKIYKNGDKYIGEFKNNLRDGKGIYYYNKKNEYHRERYEGEWKNDKREGKGILYWNNGNRFEGEYKEDKREGKGIEYYISGDRYDGNFKKR